MGLRRDNDNEGWARREALFRWLTSQAVVRVDGAVLSWHNPAHPGFPYPEAAALWLSWAAWRHARREPTPEVDQITLVAARLSRELLEQGGIGVRGSNYLFDTCLALDALARTELSGPPGTKERDQALAVASGRLSRWVDEPAPVVPMPRDPDRWSRRWDAHLLRASGILGRAARILDRADLLDISRCLVERIPGRGAIEAPDYLHARCYALEGRWMLEGAIPDVEEAIAALAEHQQEDGSLPARAGEPGDGRSDATAQAVRLWCASNPDAFARRIRRGISWLLDQTDPSDGIRYEAGSEDLNTWAALFTDQALAWATDGESDGAWI